MLRHVTSYAVVWQQGSRLLAGKLELRARVLRFEARASREPERSIVTEVPYAALAAVRVDRYGGDQLYGLPTLVLERHAGEPIRVAGVVQPGVVADVAERLVERLRGSEDVAVAG